MAVAYGGDASSPELLWRKIIDFSCFYNLERTYDDEHWQQQKRKPLGQYKENKSIQHRVVVLCVYTQTTFTFLKEGWKNEFYS